MFFFQECQYQQAVEMILESHKLVGTMDELYWFETIKIVVDSQKDDTSLKQHKQKASNSCIDALNMFKDVFQKRPSEMSTNSYIFGLLEAK